MRPSIRRKWPSVRSIIRATDSAGVAPRGRVVGTRPAISVARCADRRGPCAAAHTSSRGTRITWSSTLGATASTSSSTAKCWRCPGSARRVRSWRPTWQSGWKAPCWAVRAAAIEQFSRGPDGSWVLVEHGPGAVLRLPCLSAELRVDEVCEGVALVPAPRWPAARSDGDPGRPSHQTPICRRLPSLQRLGPGRST